MGTASNLDKLCRICTNDQVEGVLIFSDDGKKLYLEAKMKKYLYITVTSEDNLPKMVCTNCCKKLDSIHRFASMAVKMQDKLRNLVENRSSEDGKKEHSILHSILSKGAESECEVTEVEVRVDPMLFLCAFEDGGSDMDEFDDDEEDEEEEFEEDEDQDTDMNIHECSMSETNEPINQNEDHQNHHPPPLPPPPPPPPLPPTALQQLTSSAEKEIKPYRCSLCARGFNSDIGLQNHLWSHLPRDRRILSNTDNNQLERGVLHTHTGVGSTMRFVCPICGKKISTKGNLKVHLETHRPKGKYGCDICGRVFKTQSNLYRHKDYHGGVQFPCGVCGRVYPTNSTLRAHSITHSDLRPHACPLCDKTFKRNQDLKV